MTEKNIFVYGSQVSKSSFFGRKSDIRELTRAMDVASGNKGIAVMGMNRIGKSSLIHKVLSREARDPKKIILSMDVPASGDPRTFWHSLVSKLEGEADKKGIIDDYTARCFDRILRSSDIEAPQWFLSVFEINFWNIMDSFKNLGYRTVLFLDEFDRACDLFSSELASFAFIRNCATLSSYSVTIITASRRRIENIEKDALRGSGSTLSEAVTKYNLRGFSDSDMSEYISAFSLYDIFPDSDDKLMAALDKYAGRHPYLLSFYGYHLACRAMDGRPVNAAAVEEINAEHRGGSLVEYYEKLVARIIEDGYSDKLRAILCGPCVDVSEDDISKLTAWGYLCSKKGGYYTVCSDFNEYFIKNVVNITGNTWTSIMNAEIRLRSYVRERYPYLDEFRYSEITNFNNLQNQINSIYRGARIRINADNIRSFMNDASCSYNKDSTLVDVMTLTDHLRIVCDNWNSFKCFFNNDDLGVWEHKFELIKKVRGSWAHSHPELPSAVDNNLVQLYCAQILDCKKR